MKGVQEYYDKTAAEWAANGYDDQAYLPCLDEFLSLLPPGGRVLDLCCGAGYETGRIRAREIGRASCKERVLLLV